MILLTYDADWAAGLAFKAQTIVVLQKGKCDMESLFENQTIYSRKLFMETQSAAYNRYHKTFRMFLLILAVIFMIAALIFAGIFIANENMNFLIGAIIFFVISFVLLILHFQAYKYRANSAFKTSRALNPSGEHSYSVYSDNIELTTSQSNQTILLEQISKIFETKSAFCIMVESTFLFLAKDGFTKGNYSDFRGFLKQTCGKKYQ